MNADIDYGNDVDRLKRLLRQRDRMALISREYWVRAAKSAMAGDFRELRNRVALAESGPVDVILSTEVPVENQSGR